MGVGVRWVKYQKNLLAKSSWPKSGKTSTIQCTSLLFHRHLATKLPLVPRVGVKCSFEEDFLCEI